MSGGTGGLGRRRFLQLLAGAGAAVALPTLVVRPAAWSSAAAGSTAEFFRGDDGVWGVAPSPAGEDGVLEAGAGGVYGFRKRTRRTATGRVEANDVLGIEVTP